MAQWWHLSSYVIQLYINGELLVVNKQGYFDNVTQLKNCFSLQEMDLGRGLERLMKLAVSFKPYISSYIVRNWFLHLIHFSDVKKKLQQEGQESLIYSQILLK